MEEKLDQVSGMVYQIGVLAESTLGVITGLIHKIDSMEEKIGGLEGTIRKNQANFMIELEKRDREIAALQEMNQRIIADYEEKIKIIEGRREAHPDVSSYYN